MDDGVKDTLGDGIGKTKGEVTLLSLSLTLIKGLYFPFKIPKGKLLLMVN